MSYIFLTSSIAERLWKKFSNVAGINTDKMHLQQLITSWWKLTGPAKLQAVYKTMPTIVMWTLWKRRNARKHGENVSYTSMEWQIQDIVKKFIKVSYPWVKGWSWNWFEMVEKLKELRPKLHFVWVTWKYPNSQRLKCNTDGASRGNPGLSSYGFCTRDDRGDLIFAEQSCHSHRYLMEEKKSKK
ncbi:hypothetical protein R3W88_025448 [Solanum pinnatisectum]|uniref:Uncharacterized protein n=1 Tax=Solanum pinnatisectum TaxID=50273 RepID=A0AAV9M321_9SOLN|nr:hypothetical protein R3W88_025448 [Solanum pinnatisectum]